MSETTHSGSTPRESVRRVALASMIGTSIEWYDFFIFGTASALVFGRLFFPNVSELAGTLAAFATFAVGFVARPVGGLVFGHFGDRLGRKTTLVVTLTMMGLATFAMGLMPSYDTIGVWAPILMVVLRFVQGLAVGGEWGGAVLMATEHAGGQRRGFFGSFAQVGSAVGGLMSTGMFLLMQQLPEEDFVAWGWRVPFLVSIVLVVVGLFIRLRIMESPEFAKLKESRRVVKVPVVELLRTDTRNVLLAAGLYCAHGILFYAMTVYTLAYTTAAYGLERNTYLIGVTAAGAGQLITIPLLGALSDKLGRRPVIIFGTLFIIAFAVPLNFMITSQLPGAHVARGRRQHLRRPQLRVLADGRPLHGDVPGARPLQRRLVGLPARRRDRRVRTARRGFARRRRGRRLLADRRADRARRARRLRVHPARAPHRRGAGAAEHTLASSLQFVTCGAFRLKRHWRPC